jgi:hypothetical protein
VAEFEAWIGRLSPPPPAAAAKGEVKPRLQLLTKSDAA